MKEPLELVVRGHEDTIVALACPECGMTFPLQDKERVGFGCCHARKYICACGAECDEFYTACKDCRHKQAVEKEQARFWSAEKLTIEQYDGAVFWADETGEAARDGSCGEGYFCDVGELLDECESEGIDAPKYVYCVSPQRMKIDVSSILEVALEDFSEGTYDHLENVDGLQKLIDAWIDDQELGSFKQDKKRVVLLDQALQPQV